MRSLNEISSAKYSSFANDRRIKVEKEVTQRVREAETENEINWSLGLSSFYRIKCEKGTTLWQE